VNLADRQRPPYPAGALVRGRPAGPHQDPTSRGP
jgi:hypothetical protein